MRRLALTFCVTALCFANAKKLAMKDLPPEVQKTVQDQLKGGEIKNISKEVEKGVTQFEVETMLDGKHRDFEVDSKGTLLVVEDEVSIDAIPAAVKGTILKSVGSGKLVLVQTVNKPGGEMMYEAAWTGKSGKKHEVLVKADGRTAKD